MPVIRDDQKAYMRDLKNWLAETDGESPEEMGGFFEARIGMYEAHMAVWEEAYRRFARLLPEGCRNILDLGCGTGLELDEIWKARPDISVTGVDLCRSMLDRLLEKHGDKSLCAVCADYFQYDMGRERWDAVISFESLHHFLPERKRALYRKIYLSLKEGAPFLLGDYIACCPEEEDLLRGVYLEKRERFHLPENQFIHFDIPLTYEHEAAILREAGFSAVSVADSMDGATLIAAQK